MPSSSAKSSARCGRGIGREIRQPRHAPPAADCAWPRARSGRSGRRLGLHGGGLSAGPGLRGLLDGVLLDVEHDRLRCESSRCPAHRRSRSSASGRRARRSDSVCSSGISVACTSLPSRYVSSRSPGCSTGSERMRTLTTASAPKNEASFAGCQISSACTTRRGCRRRRWRGAVSAATRRRRPPSAESPTMTILRGARRRGVGVMHDAVRILPDPHFAALVADCAGSPREQASQQQDRFMEPKHTDWRSR